RPPRPLPVLARRVNRRHAPRAFIRRRPGGPDPREPPEDAARADHTKRGLVGGGVSSAEGKPAIDLLQSASEAPPQPTRDHGLRFTAALLVLPRSAGPRHLLRRSKTCFNLLALSLRRCLVTKRVHVFIGSRH